MSTSFVHLHLRSEYSLTDGVIRLERPDPIQDDQKKRHLDERFKPLAERAAELKLPALALTDDFNLCGAIKFYKSSEAQGIKPILGADVRIAGESPDELTLLVENDAGYRNLMALLSRAYLQGQAQGQPRIAREWLSAHAQGLIALAGVGSDVGRELQNGHVEAAERAAQAWAVLFPQRFFLEITRCGRPHDEPHLQAAVALARAGGWPLVASNDVRFLQRQDFAAHEARICIATGRVINDPNRPKTCSPEQYLKSAEEMAALFADLPEALANTVEIARRCNLSLTLGKNHLPDFAVPKGSTMSTYLREQSQQGLQQRLREHPPAKPLTVYVQRLDYELDVIEKMGFAGYFLVVADFIRWAKSNGVPVGPGRGSGAGSLVAYALGITDLDPLPYDLLFERFLNPERVSLPDFDVDFCMEGRDRVITYVTEKYGRDHVGQIITYGTMAARAVVRDVARVLGLPYIVGDKISKMIPGGPTGLTLGEALDEVAELKQARKDDEEVQAVVELGLQLEGLTRNAGVHAGGVVIAPRPLTDFTPLYCEAGGGGVRSQFDMKDLESVGLVKFDFLGLRTLTIIQLAVDRINAARPADTPPLEILKLPLDDKATYAVYASGHTTAVFQMESGGMQRASVDLKPDNFEDVIALISLFRPGPMELIPQFCSRKHGREKIEYLHPAMEDALKPTYGIFVYQEQVMQVARQLAGYTLGAADLLRRAMGKKIASEMAKQRNIFVEGCIANGIAGKTAGDIFNLMEKFANYGFNKSHAAAYALVSYQTAWLKAHHPAQFMAAVLSCDMQNLDSVVLMVTECRRLGLTVHAPDINRSQFRFTVDAGGAIVYGLGAIKGAGEGALTGVLDERDRNGPFADLFDLCRRVDSQKTNKRVLEALIQAGALDALGANRATLMRDLATAMQFGAQTSAADSSDLFGPKSATDLQKPRQTAEPDWSDLERLRREKETLGLYLSGHPIESHREFIAKTTGTTLKKASELAAPVDPTARFGQRGTPVMVMGWVTGLRKFNGGRRAVITLDDRTAQVQVPFNEDAVMRGLPRVDTLILVSGNISPDTFTGGYQIYPRQWLDEATARSRFAERVILRWPSDRPLNADRLAEMLTPARDPQGCPVTLHYSNNGARATLDLGAEWKLGLHPERLEALRQRIGEQHLDIVYRRASFETPQHDYES